MNVLPRQGIASEDACALLGASRLFDLDWYRAETGQADPVRHYLEQGWREGREPNPGFPGRFLAPYLATAGFAGPPALTWLTLRAAGWPMPDSVADLEYAANIVRTSGFFDQDRYARLTGTRANGLDPALHYVLVGERLGIPPSEAFDPAYYAERNPDVGRSNMVWLVHYIDHGRQEARRYRPGGGAVHRGRAPDPALANVLLVVHETSRTGAPILGWNIARALAATCNVYTLHLGEGALTPAFHALSVETIGPFLGADRDPLDVTYALKALLERVELRFVLINSAEARMVIEPLAKRLVATVFLMHEFAAYVFPAASLRTAFDWATEIVFPAPLVARAALAVHPLLRARAPRLLPQGMSVVPGSEAARDAEPVATIAALARRRREEGAFIVLGAGLVQIRKGVDVFLAVAAAVLRARPARPVHFLWVGQGYRPETDMAYSVYLHEQLVRSNLVDHVTFQDEVEDLEAVYALADAFLLTSRLDPLPNVCIDAAIRGLPIVCFREASGIADILMENPVTAPGVADHLDPEGAAARLLGLMGDESGRQAVAAATRDLAATRFDMAAYVARLLAVGDAAAARMARRAADCETLLAGDVFDQEMFLGPDPAIESRRASIIRYLTIAAALGGIEPGATEPALRRPAPGFHPAVYAAHHPGLATSGVDPLADFVACGCPPGPWQADILRIDRPAAHAATPPPGLRVALHAHFYYTELAGDFLLRLRANRTPVDLLVSTDDAGKAAVLRQAFARWRGGRLLVRVLPNRGRDLGPLLAGFADELPEYDLIGHLHAKRSRSSGSDAMGDGWRAFLWHTLLGGRYPALDVIASRFAADPGLGLVFPGDPHLLGWAGNRAMAADLARRMGRDAPLPDALDFPVGAMFWARRAALRPLLDLGLTWTDFPDEPVAYDGTILHALERLPVIAAEQAGFRYAVTHVPGISWAP